MVINANVRLYPFFHVCFRTSEVISRLALLGGFLAICAFHCGLPRGGRA